MGLLYSCHSLHGMETALHSANFHSIIDHVIKVSEWFTFPPLKYNKSFRGLHYLLTCKPFSDFLGVTSFLYFINKKYFKKPTGYA